MDEQRKILVSNLIEASASAHDGCDNQTIMHLKDAFECLEESRLWDLLVHLEDLLRKSIGFTERQVSAMLACGLLDDVDSGGDFVFVHKNELMLLAIKLAAFLENNPGDCLVPRVRRSLEQAQKRIEKELNK